jgi:hypothetical protein
LCSIYVLILSGDGENQAMTDERPLRPATAEELEDTLTFALRFKGRKRWDGAGPMIASIAAESLRKALEEAGYVVMKKPGAQAPSTTPYHRT